MYKRSSQFIVAACLAVLGGPSASRAQQPAVTDAFTLATAEYAQLHRRIENMLGGLSLTAVPADVVTNVSAMSTAIRAERANARPGDFFTPPLAADLRRQIAAALAANGLTAADVAADEIPEGVSRQSLRLVVGGPFPWLVGSTTLPCLIAALPPLPPELQYRFVFRDLALVDVHANMVVDILPDALPATEF